MSTENGSLKRLADRVAIITGGGQGIGRTTAHRFAQEGAAVVIADLAEEQGECVVQEIEEQGGRALFVRTNVAELEQTDELARRAAEAFGKIEILVNNAGIVRDATLVKMEEKSFDQVIDVNLKGVFNTAKSTVPYMIEAGYGRILNASSVVGIYGNFGQTNYVATKAGVIGMTKVWARELGRKGITANAVAPGFIQTEMIGDVPDKVIDMMTNRTPVNRLGQPEDIANAYVFLASPEASFITGTVLSVDGGLIL